jgi:hypothetical protein
MQHHSLPLSYPNFVVLIKSFCLVPHHLQFLICGGRDLGWHLKAGNSNGHPFDASTSELSPLNFTLIFPDPPAVFGGKGLV